LVVGVHAATIDQETSSYNLELSMDRNFDRSLSRVLRNEGGYVNHPKDPGGATQMGVTQKVYDAYRSRLGLKRGDVRYISKTEVAQIYRDSYWVLAKCDQLPDGVDYVVFDGAVNSGVSQSAKWLQRALGVNADGVIGPATIAAALRHPNHDQLVADILDLRLRFLKSLKTWKTFGKGWAARVADVKATGQAWASGADAPAPVTLYETAKAYPSDVKAAPSPAVADAATGGGIASGGLAATLQQVQDQLTPLSYSSELVGKVVAGLVIASALLTVGGLAYGFYARRRKARIAEATT
jgi:lysozyme family protein